MKRMKFFVEVKKSFKHLFSRWIPAYTYTHGLHCVRRALCLEGKPWRRRATVWVSEWVTEWKAIRDVTWRRSSVRLIHSKLSSYNNKETRQNFKLPKTRPHLVPFSLLLHPKDSKASQSRHHYYNTATIGTSTPFIMILAGYVYTSFQSYTRKVWQFLLKNFTSSTTIGTNHMQYYPSSSPLFRRLLFLFFQIKSTIHSNHSGLLLWNFSSSSLLTKVHRERERERKNM